MNGFDDSINVFSERNKLNNNRDRLYRMLVNFGFTRSNNNGHIMFKYDDEVLVFPDGELDHHHFITVRHHLDMNGWMEEGDFNRSYSY